MIFYKGKRMIHSSIIVEYETQFKGDIERIIKRATSKQNIILTDSKKVKKLSSTEDFEDFLRKNSKLYANCY